MQTIQRRADSEFSSHDQELGPAASHDPPLDLVHLSQQCQGDPDLEDEVLSLFRLQSTGLGARIADPALGAAARAHIAHTLRGSALAVGAGRVARAAAAIEEVALRRPDPEGEVDRVIETAHALAALAAAVVEAVGEIDRLRG